MSSNKVRPSVYMALCMMAWATVAALTAVVKGYTGLVLVRFFLGIVEAPFYPGALYILSLFYTRKEIATRVSILYAGNIFAVSFAGLIAAATFSTLDGAHRVHGVSPRLVSTKVVQPANIVLLLHSGNGSLSSKAL